MLNESNNDIPILPRIYGGCEVPGYWGRKTVCVLWKRWTYAILIVGSSTAEGGGSTWDVENYKLGTPRRSRKLQFFFRSIPTILDHIPDILPLIPYALCCISFAATLAPPVQTRAGDPAQTSSAAMFTMLLNIIRDACCRHLQHFDLADGRRRGTTRILSDKFRFSKTAFCIYLGMCRALRTRPVQVSL